MAANKGPPLETHSGHMEYMESSQGGPTGDQTYLAAVGCGHPIIYTSGASLSSVRSAAASHTNASTKPCHTGGRNGGAKGIYR